MRPTRLDPSLIGRKAAPASEGGLAAAARFLAEFPRSAMPAATRHHITEAFGPIGAALLPDASTACQELRTEFEPMVVA